MAAPFEAVHIRPLTDIQANGDAAAPRARDIGTNANIYVQPNEASLERKLSDVYGNGNADNDSGRPS